MGIGILQLAGIPLGSLNFREGAQPHPRYPSTVTNKAVTLAILDDGATVTVDDVLRDDPIKYLAPVGRRNPAAPRGRYCSPINRGK